MSDEQTESSTPPTPTIAEFNEAKASVMLHVPDGPLPTSWSDVLPAASAQSENASPPQGVVPPPAEAPAQKPAE